MMRWIIIGLFLMTGAPAAAEDWWHVATDGEAPARKTGVFDVDSIDKSDPVITTLNSALWSETPDEMGGVVIIAKLALKCDAAEVAIAHVEIRDSQGNVLASASLEDQPFEVIETDSHIDMVRRAVCDDHWQWPDAFQFGEGKTLTQIAGEVFKD